MMACSNKQEDFLPVTRTLGILHDVGVCKTCQRAIGLHDSRVSHPKLSHNTTIASAALKALSSFDTPILCQIGIGQVAFGDEVEEHQLQVNGNTWWNEYLWSLPLVSHVASFFSSENSVACAGKVVSNPPSQHEGSISCSPSSHSYHHSGGPPFDEDSNLYTINDDSFTEFLVYFYSQFNPEKIRLIDYIAQEYVGDELIMISHLAQKYQLSAGEMQQIIDEFQHMHSNSNGNGNAPSSNEDSRALAVAHQPGPDSPCGVSKTHADQTTTRQRSVKNAT